MFGAMDIGLFLHSQVLIGLRPGMRKGSGTPAIGESRSVVPGVVRVTRKATSADADATIQ
jgi:hypothetical protein